MDEGLGFWVLLQLLRLMVLGVVIPFALVGFMVCLPDREFRQDLFSRGVNDNGKG